MPKLSKVPSVRQRVSADEWQARLELAAAYRLVAHYGWTHLINNHISVRVPGTEDQPRASPTACRAKLRARSRRGSSGATGGCTTATGRR